MRMRLLLVLAICQLTSNGLLAVGGVDTAPSPSAPHEIKFVTPAEAKLPNGLRVIVAERPQLPLLAVQLVVGSGAETDPPDRAGTASLTGSLLTKGTEKMSAPEIAAAIESLGGSIFSGATWDFSGAGVMVMSDKAEPALAVLADVVQHPAFKEDEIERSKRQTLDRLRVALRQPAELAGYVLTRVTFPSGEYAHPAGGTMESIEMIRRDDITRLYGACYRPENAALVFSGDVTLARAKELAAKFFGEWKAAQSNDTPTRPTPAESRAWKPQNIVVDMPEAGQAAVSVAKPAIKRTSPDYYTGLVVNAALGSGFGSRLNREIRIKRGLSYGASSSLSVRRDAGAFTAAAQTKNESALEVADLIRNELARLAADPVRGDELKSRQAMLVGSFGRSMETNSGVAGQVASLAVYGLSLDTLNKYIPAISKVTTEDTVAFARRFFSTPGSLVVVGKASSFGDRLKKEAAEVRVIPASDLDLNRAELVKGK